MLPHRVRSSKVGAFLKHSKGGGGLFTLRFGPTV